MSGVDVVAVLRSDANEALMFREGSCGLQYVARKTLESNTAIAAVAELIAAAKEDAEMPSSIGIEYRDRQNGEPEGPAWWAFKRNQIESRGYCFGWERYDGSEIYYKDGPTTRLIAALAAATGESHE